MIGPTAFAVLVWGAVALVLGVFAYQVYAVARDRWVDASSAA